MSTIAPVAASANPLKDQLDRDGFVRVPGVIDPVTIDTLLLRAQATLFRATQAERDAVKSTGSLIHLSDHPEYADIIGYPPLIALLRTLDASDPRWTGGFLISKPAGGPPLFWHQDWWGWTEPESYAVRPQQWFAMIYLTDTTPENGCLRVIPGTHRRDHPLHHLEAAHSEALQRFQNPDDPVYGSHPDEVPVPVRAGDVLIGDARLIHGAYGNRTAQERPLLTLWYMPHWSGMSPGMRARAMLGYLRDDDIPTPERPLTPLDWTPALRRRIETILPTDEDKAAPIPWQRIPDVARFVA
ncbi:MAG: phytanoyl-CoA dioxygenase family protein [Luteimonas sp.]|nr:phytanoyl-CoA dioxygenase family protein [Luteimonas sp.]